MGLQRDDRHIHRLLAALETAIRGLLTRALLAASLSLLASATAAEPRPRTAVYLSPVYTIDRIYKSMQGPYSQLRIRLLDHGEPPELLWITGFRTEIVSPDGTRSESREFMCHINLDADVEGHRRLFGWSKLGDERVFTLSQGQTSLHFPAGYAVPVMSDEPLTLFTQVLNHNVRGRVLRVRHRVTVEYLRDRDLKAPITPLFVASAFVMALVEGKDGYFDQAGPTAATAHASCDPGAHAPRSIMGLYQDGYGRKLTGHWIVKPGPETRHTVVTRIMHIPFDTTAHYIAAHLHPFASSLELRDLTTGESVYKTRARGPARGIGLEKVGFYSSARGVPLFKDHEYELVSVYDNTSGIDQDSMASMFLYLEDKEFKKPGPRPGAVP